MTNCPHLLFVFQTFITSAFNYNVTVEKDFLSAPVVNISEVHTSPEKRRVSVKGAATEVSSLL